MRLIDADALIDKAEKNWVWEEDDEDKTVPIIRYKDIINAPTIDAEPIRHGHWIGIDDEPCEVFECDKCGYIIEDMGCAGNKPNNFNYCPRCGALMEEVEE